MNYSTRTCLSYLNDKILNYKNDSPSQTSVTEVKRRPIEIVLGWGTNWVGHSVCA
jgi:hypothetical protein